MISHFVCGPIICRDNASSTGAILPPALKAQMTIERSTVEIRQSKTRKVNH
jgi:hypothetical protein